MHTGADPSTQQSSETRVIHRGGSDLVNRLDEVTGRSDLFVPYCATLIVLFLLMLVGLSGQVTDGLSSAQVAVVTLLIIVPLGSSIPIKRWSEQRRTLQIIYDLSRPDIMQRLACASTIGATLAKVERLWKLSSPTVAPDDAHEMLQPRLAARCTKGMPSHVELNLECWCVLMGPSRVFFLPDCLLVEQEGRLSAFTYDELSVEVGTVRYTEWDAVATDTQVVEEQWRFVKEGAERMDDVRHVAICEFGELCLTHKDDWQLVLQASDARAMHQAGRALRELVLAAQVENGTAVAVPTPVVGSVLAASSPRGLLAPDKEKSKEPAEPPRPAGRACPKCEHLNAESDRFCHMCGHGMADLQTGAVVRGRYVVLGHLGPGAAGMLYRAWDTTLEKAWLLKEIAVEGRTEKERKDATIRFDAEGQMLRAVQHAALPAVRDHFTENGAHYVVMELGEGETLSEILERDGKPGLAEEGALRIADDLLEVLEFLHEQEPPIYYRGLQPLLVLREKRAAEAPLAPATDALRLLDLGAVRTTRGLSAGAMASAARYAAPETRKGSGGDARSDLYALAALVHHLLTGKVPNDDGKFEPVRAMAAEVSERTEQVLKRSLYDDPAQRYETATEMRAALRGVTLDDASRPRPPRDISIRTESLHTFVINGMCHSVCFTPDAGQLMTGCYDIKLWDLQTRTEIRRAELGKGATCCALISPDGALLAYGSLDGGVHLQTTRPGGEKKNLLGHADQVASLAFSPTGPLLGSASLDGTVRLWDVTETACKHTLAAVGHLPRALAFSPTGTRLVSAFTNLAIWDTLDGSLITHVPSESLARTSVRAVAYSPDGKLLACACSDSTVRLLDAQTLQVVRCLEGHENQVLALAWAPIGWLLASGASDTTVRLWDAESGDVAGCLEGHGSAVSTLAWSSDGRRLASGSWDLTARLWSISYDRGGLKIPVTRFMPKGAVSGI